MATIVSALLQTSQDRDSGVPERLQSLESSVAALSESVARWQVPRVAERQSLAKSSPFVERERAAIELCIRSSITLEKVSERLKHLAVHLFDGH